MLSHEWRELELLCERISDLRHRYVAAQRTKNSGLVEGLKEDIAKARRQREYLVHHISARLSAAAAEEVQSQRGSERRRREAEEDASGSAGLPEGDAATADTVGNRR